MQVTKIEPAGKTKFKIYIDEQFAFELYKGELSRFHIVEQKNIDEETVEHIKKDVLLKRVKLRAMHLLNDMDRTEDELLTKLKRGGYTDELAAEAIRYVKSFGYIDDENYVRRFIESKKQGKSKKEIYALLLKKGINKELIQNGMEKAYESDDEADAVRTLLRKKRFSPECADHEQKQKICAYLMRKGFRYETIRQVIQVSDWNA